MMVPVETGEIIISRLLARFAVICLLVLPRPAAAQDQPVAGFEDLVEVTEVLLDVLAVNRSGAIVTGLGKDDFLVEENREPVEITGVSFYTTRYGAGGELLTADGAVPSSRYFIFFFHDRTRSGSIGNYLARRQVKARNDSLRWVEDHMLASDWVAVASYDYKLKVHQDFTQDRFVIAEGIQSANTRRDPEKDRGRHGRVLPPSAAPSLLRHLPQGKELRRTTATTHDGLRLLAEAAGFVVGRKNLMLFSAGFGQVDFGGPIPELDWRRYPQMMHALNDHNVAVYPIDLAPPEIRHFQGPFLSRLAFDTGGRYYRNLLGFITPLTQISEENAGYYLLSYQSEHPAKEAGYQKVEVRPRDRSIKLRARKGYRFGSGADG